MDDLQRDLQLRKSGAKIGLCGQAPSDHPEFATFLVECGINSISVSPDSFIAVKQIVAAAERRPKKGDKTMNAIDIMTAGAITVRPDTMIAHAARLMLEHRISGLPVVNAQGELSELSPKATCCTGRRLEPSVIAPMARNWMNAGQLAQEYAQEHGRKVEQVMTRDVVSADQTRPSARSSTSWKNTTSSVCRSSATAR